MNDELGFILFYFTFLYFGLRQKCDMMSQSQSHNHVIQRRM